MQWYPEQGSLWCTAALANLHLICMLFVWGPAQPSLVAHGHYIGEGGQEGRGHILYTPHGHTDSRSPGGGAGRVRSSTTKKGVSHGHSAGTRDDFLPVAAGQHEMWSVCRCWAGPGSSPSLASSQGSGDSVFALYAATFIFRHFMRTVLPAH